MTTPTARSSTFDGTKKIVGWLLAVGGVLLAVGLFVGLGSVGNCGSAWFPSAESLSSQLDRGLGVSGGGYDADCQQQVGSRGDLGAVLVGLAGVFLLGSVLVWNQERMTWLPRERTVEAVADPVG